MARKTSPAFPAHAKPAILCIWWEAHGTAVSKMLSLVTPSALKLPGNSFVFTSLNISPHKWKLCPRMLNNDTEKANCCNELSHVYHTIHNTMEFGIMPLKTVTVHFAWVVVITSSHRGMVRPFWSTGHQWSRFVSMPCFCCRLASSWC